MNRRERAPEEVPATSGRESPIESAPAPAERILALQRSAGNQAVARMLAGGGGGGAGLQRDVAAPAPSGEGEAKEKESSTVIVVEGLGTFAVEAVQFEGRDGKDVSVTMRAGADKNQSIFRAAAEGKSFESAEIRIKGMSITLAKVMITSVHVSSAEDEPMISFTLSPLREREAER